MYLPGDERACETRVSGKATIESFNTMNGRIAVHHRDAKEGGSRGNSERPPSSSV
jgi:hypothetical protein